MTSSVRRDSSEKTSSSSSTKSSKGKNLFIKMLRMTIGLLAAGLTVISLICSGRERKPAGVQARVAVHQVPATRETELNQQSQVSLLSCPTSYHSRDSEITRYPSDQSNRILLASILIYQSFRFINYVMQYILFIFGSNICGYE